MTIILILLAEVKGEIVGFAHAEVQYRTTHIPAIIGSRLVQEICRFFRRKMSKIYTLDMFWATKKAKNSGKN